MIAPDARSEMVSQSYLRQRRVQGIKFGAHLLTQLVDELGRVQRFAQRRVMLDSAFFEIGG